MIKIIIKQRKMKKNYDVYNNIPIFVVIIMANNSIMSL